MTIFSNVRCSGRSAAFFASPELFEKQSYTNDNIKQLGLSDNSASSLAIPYGYAVDLYGANGFIPGKAFTVEGEFYGD